MKRRRICNVTDRKEKRQRKENTKIGSAKTTCYFFLSLWKVNENYVQ
jgi:hypothetical protein